LRVEEAAGGVERVELDTTLGTERVALSRMLEEEDEAALQSP
jgi:hypothetical protein